MKGKKNARNNSGITGTGSSNTTSITAGDNRNNRPQPVNPSASGTDNNAGKPNGTNVVNASANVVNDGSEPTKRKRGRPAGSRNRNNGFDIDRTANRGSGDGSGTGTGAGTETILDSETPIYVGKTRGRKPGKNKESHAEKLAVLGLLGVSLNAVYGTASMFLGEHWNLTDRETIDYATAVNNALETLPYQQYANLKKYVEKYIPWIALVITAGAITIPRYEYTKQLRKAGTKPVESSPVVDAQPSTNTTERNETFSEPDASSDVFASFGSAD